jgi:hypothetical protein
LLATSAAAAAAIFSGSGDRRRRWSEKRETYTVLLVVDVEMFPQHGRVVLVVLRGRSAD